MKAKRKPHSYLSEFLSLQCAGDVLNVVAPVDQAAKEITEAMAVIRTVRSIVRRKPKEYLLADLCSGNALVPVIAAHLLPVAETVAMDKEPRERHWEQCKRFMYIQWDIVRPFPWWPAPSIITAVRPCRGLAPACIKAFVESKAEYMVLMPCCEGRMEPSRRSFLGVELTRYERWCLYLEGLFPEGFRVSSYRDAGVPSPCNVIIVAKRAKEEKA